MSELGITRGDFGATYRIVVKNVNYSAQGANINIQSSGGTMLVTNSTCTVTATDENRNTLVEWTPASGQFGATASLVDYLATVTFSGAGLRDSTYKFNWQVYDELRG